MNISLLHNNIGNAFPWKQQQFRLQILTIYLLFCSLLDHFFL
jgi:hypothetical protein